MTKATFTSTLGASALVLALGRPALGQDGPATGGVAATPSGDDATAPSGDDGPLVPDPIPSIAAVVPGVVVHGTGHFLAGRPTTGWRLLAMEGIGLGLAAIGGVTLAVTGANRAISAPAAATAIAGASLLHSSHLADFVGVTFRDGPGEPDVTTPMVMTEIGYRYVEDPQFRYHHFLVQGIDLRASRLRFNPTAWFALDDTNARIRALGAVRLFGPLPKGERPVALDGSFLDLEIAGLHHGYRTDGFRVVTGELSIAGRLDLRHIDPYLRGSFTELSTGVGAQFFDYDGAPRSFGNHIESLLLGRFAYGMYLGRPRAPHGELSMYYEHRHDDYAGGTAGFSIGIIGHFGLAGRVMLTDEWGLASDLTVGSAFVGGLSFLYRKRDD